MKKIIKNRLDRGFTLIELMVVMSIIALLSSIILVAVKDVRDKAVATKFKAEMQQFVNALELYKTDKGVYPYEGGNGVSNYQSFVYNSNLEASLNPSGVTISSFLIPKYISKLPKIPVNSYDQNYGGYWYYTNNINSSILKKCSDNIKYPPYIISIADTNPFIHSLYSDLPFRQDSGDSGSTYATTTHRCISPK